MSQRLPGESEKYWIVDKVRRTKDSKLKTLRVLIPLSYRNNGTRVPRTPVDSMAEVGSWWRCLRHRWCGCYWVLLDRSRRVNGWGGGGGSGRGSPGAVTKATDYPPGNRLGVPRRIPTHPPTCARICYPYAPNPSILQILILLSSLRCAWLRPDVTGGRVIGRPKMTVNQSDFE